MLVSDYQTDNASTIDDGKTNTSAQTTIPQLTVHVYFGFGSTMKRQKVEAVLWDNFLGYIEVRYKQHHCAPNNTTWVG